MSVLILGALKKNTQNIFTGVESSKKIDNEIVKLKNTSACHKASTYSLENHQIRKTLSDLHQNYTAESMDKPFGYYL